MIVFKILLIILVALPVVAFAGFLYVSVIGYIDKLNARDRKREALEKQAEMYRRAQQPQNPFADPTRYNTQYNANINRPDPYNTMYREAPPGDFQYYNSDEIGSQNNQSVRGEKKRSSRKKSSRKSSGKSVGLDGNGRKK